MAKSMRIKTDDQVMVIGGKDAGKTGRVIRTEPKKRRVYVEHLNMVKRARTAALGRATRRAPTPAGSSRRRGRSTSPT